MILVGVLSFPGGPLSNATMRLVCIISSGQLLCALAFLLLASLLFAFDLAGQMALLYIMPLYFRWISSSNDDGCSR